MNYTKNSVTQWTVSHSFHQWILRNLPIFVGLRTWKLQLTFIYMHLPLKLSHIKYHWTGQPLHISVTLKVVTKYSVFYRIYTIIVYLDISNTVLWRRDRWWQNTCLPSPTQNLKPMVINMYRSGDGELISVALKGARWKWTHDNRFMQNHYTYCSKPSCMVEWRWVQ